MKTTTTRRVIRTHGTTCIMRETEAGSDGCKCSRCGKQRIVEGKPQQLFVYFTECRAGGELTIQQHDGSFCSNRCHDLTEKERPLE